LSVVLLAVVMAQNCNIQVPPEPLTAQGLATPYILITVTATTPCTMANTGTQAFVHGVIVDVVTGKLMVYNPLVITQGTTALVQPTVPTLPAQFVVGIWFGYNGGTLTLVSTPGTTSVADGGCVNGLTLTTGTVDTFGQYAYCNAANFYGAVKTLVAAGKITIPPLGTATDGLTCPNTRDWGSVDQDPSDNVPTKYLVDANTGNTAQNTPANAAAQPQATAQGNPSDNALITNFIMAALGCTPWKVTDIADTTGATLTTALPLNEIQAEKFASFPQALCPLNHAMVMLGGTTINATKLNLYRVGANQPAVPITGNGVANALAVGDLNAQGSGAFFCKKLNTNGFNRLTNNKVAFQKLATPVVGIGNTLFDFLQQRFNAANTNLGCANFAGVGVVVQTL